MVMVVVVLMMMVMMMVHLLSAGQRWCGNGQGEQCGKNIRE
jgi:hypothetical protein